MSCGRVFAATWLAAGALAATGAAAPEPAAPEPFLALQATREVERVALPGSAPAAGAAREAVLTQLAPRANAWLLLSLPAPGGRGTRRFHLENADPARQRITLDPATPGTLVIRVDDAVAARCAVWPEPVLARAAATGLAYAPLCEGRLYLRQAVPARRSTLAATTQFLRDHVWQGEQIIGWVKREFYRDAFAERATASASAPAAPAPAVAAKGSPPAARLRAGVAPRAIVATGLGIARTGASQGLMPGQWAGAAALEGVWVSAVPPGAVAEGLDPVEADALAYLVAFALDRFDLGFALGTEHPRLGWSPRVLPALRDDSLPGPDGFDSAAPLVRTGMLAPPLLDSVVATFTGGFKREHGAFSHGALAAVNHGSHYGFVEQGVIFSRLQPGLATLLVRQDGTVEMRTWRAGDEQQLATLRHARQNGVPLVEPGRSGAPVAGALVAQWGAGNWSGSADEKLRSLRAGACIVEHEGRRWLVYGYFSSATPRAMARVFLAYGCGYAMHLDMNALEHTYLALYPREGTQRGIEHLVPGMAVLDKTLDSTLLPRFLAVADDRDFFYLTKRQDRR